MMNCCFFGSFVCGFVDGFVGVFVDGFVDGFVDVFVDGFVDCLEVSSMALHVRLVASDDQLYTSLCKSRRSAYFPKGFDDRF